MASITLHLIILAICFSTLTSTIILAKTLQQQFTYNGFKQAKLLHLDGGAIVHPNGLLQLTNTSKQLKGHAFYPLPINFNSSSSLSFSTTFVFAMYPEIQAITGLGLVFVIAPSMDFHLAMPGKYFGIFNASTIGNSSNHIFAVELDTLRNMDIGDIDSNHVGIDVDGIRSVAAASAGYYSDSKKQNKSLTLVSAKPMQIWIDYDHLSTLVNVTMAPLGVSRPSIPLLSTRVNLSRVVLDTMYVGLAAGTGSVAASHYVLGWSFTQGRLTQAITTLDLSKLPSLPRYGNRGPKLSITSLVLVIITSTMILAGVLVVYLRWRKKYGEILEDWEEEYVVQRFSFRDLYKATKGFKDTELLGSGGFGKVYKGILPSTKFEVAVKTVSHGSNEGMRQFVAEIACMGRLRHKNLVQLLGYCRRKGELLLVYDYMSNGSLDKYLFSNHIQPTLPWSARFKIIRDVACALVYLHEGFEQVVVHRDVKASNVLLDSNMNGRLGDFGLARLYDHGSNPQTTHIVGTVGYLAPELTRRGKATTRTDVFSFGIFVLEVACGRTPISSRGDGDLYLVDWVYNCWKRGVIVEASDPRLDGSYVIEEMELVLKMGLICSHPSPNVRPSIRQALQILDGEIDLPTIVAYNDAKWGSEKSALPAFVSSSGDVSTVFSTDSILEVGR